jgi:hypothetical protein
MNSDWEGNGINLLAVWAGLLLLVGEHVEDSIWVGDDELEGLEGVTVLAVERPANPLVERLEVDFERLRNVAHDRVHELGFVVLVLACVRLLLGDPALGEVDVALVAVDTEYDGGLLAADLDEGGDGADATAGQLGEEDHALDVVVLQEGDVRAHVGDVLHLDHHRRVHLGEPWLVHPALEVRHIRWRREAGRLAGAEVGGGDGGSRVWLGFGNAAAAGGGCLCVAVENELNEPDGRLVDRMMISRYGLCMRSCEMSCAFTPTVAFGVILLISVTSRTVYVATRWSTCRSREVGKGHPFGPSLPCACWLLLPRRRLLLYSSCLEGR